VAGFALPDVKTRIRVDSTDLDKGSSKAAKFGTDIEKHMGKGTTHTLRFAESLTTAVEHLDKLPPVVGQAGRSIESMVSSLNAGANAGALIGGAVAAGLGIAVGAIAEGVHSYIELGDQVLNYQRVTGASAEESSRMVETFDRLGISGDRASSAIFMMSKRIEASPQKFHDLGVQIAYNNDGTIALNDTLLNVAEAYDKAGNAQDRNAIAQAAFGRSARDLIPVLEQGRAGLSAIEAQAQVIFTQEDLERVHRYQLETKQLGQEWNSLGQSIGGEVLPTLLSATEHMNESIYVNQHLGEALKAAGAEGGRYSEGTAKVVAQLQAEYRASHDAKEAIDKQTQSTQAAQAASDAAAAAIDNLVQATMSQFDASIALERANLNLTKSQQAVDSANLQIVKDTQGVTDAQAALTAAIRDYGPNSQQAADATVALLVAQNNLKDSQTSLQDSLIAQKEAYLQDAAATEKDAQQRAAMIGDTLSAADSARIYRDRLQELTNTLDPASPLRKSLQGYIDELNNQVPGGVNTKLSISTPPESRVMLDEIRDELAQIKSTAASVKLPGFTGQRAFASGGDPDPGLPALVGEKGPEIWVPKAPGTIIPNDQLGGALAGLGSGPNVTINVYGSDVSAADIARELAWLQKTSSRRPM
jgi:hypothetical protein